MPVVGFSYLVDIAQKVLQDTISRVPPENEDADAYIRWGSAGSDPSIVERQIIISPFPDDEEDEEDPEDPTLIYTEIARTEVEVKVVNPDDEEQYVMVKRLSNVTFSSPDGKNRKFVFNWPTT